MHIDWRRVLIVELALLGALALAWVLWWVLGQFAHTVMLLIMGIVVAFALGPLVTRLEERIGGRRGIAAAIVYLGLLIGVFGGLTLLAAPFIQQLTALAADLPRYAELARAQLPGLEARLHAAGMPVQMSELQARAIAYLSESGGSLVGGTLSIVTGLTGFVVDLFLITVISFYLVLDSRRIRDAIMALVPARRRETALFVEETMVRIGGGYLRGQLILGAIIGALGTVGAIIFGLPYPLIIGVIAGVTELIPMIGPIIGAVPMVLLALLQPFPTVLWVILYVILVQQLENNLLVPRIAGDATGLHPLGAMLALMAGLELGGILGGLFAVPIAGVLSVLVRAAYQRLRYGDAPPPRREARPGWRIPFGQARAPKPID